MQMALIRRKAIELGITPDRTAEHWIEIFSQRFRDLWNEGIQNVDEMEDRIYEPTLGSSY